MSIFSQVSARKPRSNVFDLSHDRKFSMNFGKITPVLVTECVPGDHFKINSAQMVRFAPLVAPIMHQVSAYMHFFFIPNRILWPSWEDFITGGREGTDASVFPYVEATDFTEGSLADYLGLPTDIPNASDNIRVSAMVFNAYQKLCSEYYRDQNHNADFWTALSDGDNTADLANLGFIRTRAWQHDYFTSSLPWTQRGAEATIPLGTTADLQRVGGAGFDGEDLVLSGSAPTTIRKVSGASFAADDVTTTASGGSPGIADIQHTGDDAQILVADNTALNLSEFEVDLSNATAATINDLRQAMRLQEWLEKNARGGARYTESILSHFGVHSSDGRLQRPSFLGGSATRIQISEVLQTSDDAAETTPLANMAGHGIGVGQAKNIRYRCEEHGYIIGVMTVLAKTAYFQGIPKHWFKFDKLDYYWPSFAHLGEQPVLNKEVYVDGTDGLNDDIWGYVPRYAEYKFIPSSVHGEFRSSFDYWHLARKFSARPSLNNTFIQSAQTDYDRIFAVTTASVDKLYVHVAHHIKARRLMPYFGTPTL